MRLKDLKFRVRDSRDPMQGLTLGVLIMLL